MSDKNQQSGGVRFIRKGGRVIPIRPKKGEGGGIKPVGIAMRTQKVSTGERFQGGFVTGATIGAVFGGVGALAATRSVGAGAGQAIISGAAWGVLGGALNAAFGGA